jgi:uncharacterized membrane protein YqaE (UPF0057 family)
MRQVTVIEDDHTSPAGTICLFIVAFFIPPLAVLIVDGCRANFFLNVLLLIFTFWIGAFIHAVYIVAVQPHSQKVKTYIAPASAATV